LGGGDGTGGTGSYGGDGSGPPRSRQVGTEQQQERRQERTESARDRREARDRDEESARRVVRLEDTSEPPRPVSQEPALGYPRALREAALTGNVVLECIITDGGRVRACRRRQGPEELAEYVESIVTQWRFRPGMDHEGNPVVSTYTFRVPFRLN
jgi:TonB family protein